MSLHSLYGRIGMPHEEIDSVPIWYEEHGNPARTRRLVALHGGIITFRGSFGAVLPWLTEGRRVIGVELQGQRPHSRYRPRHVDRAVRDDVAQLIDRVADGGPVDVWGFSLGGLTATSLAVRHPAKVRRLVLAASHIRPDGYHPEITAPEQSDPRLPTEEEFMTLEGRLRVRGRRTRRTSSAVPRAHAAGRAQLRRLDRRRDPFDHRHPRASWSATATSSASTTPPRCSISSLTAGSLSCPPPDYEVMQAQRRAPGTSYARIPLR